MSNLSNRFHVVLHVSHLAFNHAKSVDKLRLEVANKLAASWPREQKLSHLRDERVVSVSAVDDVGEKHANVDGRHATGVLDEPVGDVIASPLVANVITDAFDRYTALGIVVAHVKKADVEIGVAQFDAMLLAANVHRVDDLDVVFFLDFFENLVDFGQVS